MNRIIEINNAFVAVQDGLILAFGEGNGEMYKSNHTQSHDAKGLLMTPGLIDAHTHVVHAGSREYEFEMKMRGLSYLEILKSGGGILSTVNATRKATEASLYAQSVKSLDHMLSFGVTTVEGKSGYGLNLETELKQLQVQKKLDQKHPIDIVSTYMGAHALPSEYKDKRHAFIDQTIQWMDVIRKHDLAEFVDIFCEEGAFTAEESHRYLKAAKEKGFKLKVHSDEIKSIGGVEVAVGLGAYSCDHLMAITDQGIKTLRDSLTIANILPSTSFNLQKSYAPAKKMIASDLAIAISSDYNPGSSPSENFLFSLNLAAIHLKMQPNEVLSAATINAAHAIDRSHKVGLIKEGYNADLVIYDAPNWPYVLYHFGINHVMDVYKKGQRVVENKMIRRRK